MAGRRLHAVGHAETSVLVALLHIEAGGGSPTIRELAARTGLSTSQVHKWLIRLRTAGLVSWVDNRARTLRSNVAVVVPRARGTVRP